MSEKLYIGPDEYDVIEWTPRGNPARIQHAEPFLRGSFIEARMNVALAVRNLKVELREALPMRLKRILPEPKRWWRTLPKVQP